MNYMKTFQYVFDSPKWMGNLLAAIICILVPVVGPIVLLGYGFVIIEALHRRKDSLYPDFDTDQLSDYLTRGLWPWIVAVIARLPLIFLAVLLYVFMFAGMIFASENGGVLVVLLLFCVFFVAILLLSMLLGFVLIPLVLRAGLMQDFREAFSWAFVKDFLARTWLEILLVQLFFLASGMALNLAGLLLCFVGAYPAAALLILADYHALHQLYELYLERGGTPIPFKSESLIDEEEDVPMVDEAAPSEDIQAPEGP